MKFILFLLLLFFTISFSEVYAQTITLTPTDDAYVIADLSNPDDPVSDLNTGNMTMQKIWYSFNSVIPGSNVVTLGHLKFDLSQVNQDDVLSATLNMNGFESTITNNTVAVFLSGGEDWGESSISYKTKPSFNSTSISVIDNISPTNWVQWDVTDSIKKHNSTDITFVLSFLNLKSNSDEELDLYSKESTIPNTQPFLEIKLAESVKDISSEIIPVDESEYTIIELPVLEDAYIIADYAGLEIFDELHDLNTGNANFTKIWYSYNSTGIGELLISSGYLKFDVSELNPENIISVELKMYDSLVNTSGADRLISVFTVDNSTWTESEITFDNKPELVEKLSTTQIDAVNSWISWNVTDAIKQSITPELTLSITYDEFLLGHEEQTVFNSKESSENPPYLEIVYDDYNVEGGGCLIATATYGSELAPQVQQLRELRDNYLLHTDSGILFMTGFNEFYYSFSPAIADLERENPIFRETMKILLTPMISSLSVLNYVDLDSESSVLGYGLSIILLNIGIYFVSPVAGLKIIHKFSKNYVCDTV